MEEGLRGRSLLLLFLVSHFLDKLLNGNLGTVLSTGGHPLKGTCQEKKVVRKQEEAFFFEEKMRLREWAVL